MYTQFLWILLLQQSSGVLLEEIRDRSDASLRLRESGDVEFQLAFGNLADDERKTIEWKSPYCKDHIIYDIKNGRFIYLERWTPHEAILIRNGETLSRKSPEDGSFQRLILRPDRVFEYYPDAMSDGSYLAITEDLTEFNPQEMLQPIQVWKFGLLPEVIESANDFSFEAMTKISSDPPAPIADDVNGQICWRVEYRNDGRVVTVWYDPQKNMAVSRIVMEGSHERWAWRNTIESTLANFPDGGVWFPTEVVLRSERIGSDNPAHLILQRISVSKAKFNIAIDPEQFSVKALSPAPHVAIVRRYESDSPAEEWDGSRVVARKRVTTSPPVPQPEAMTAKWRIVYLAVANLCLIAALVIWWSLKRKTASTI